jgi:hypothetical protein
MGEVRGSGAGRRGAIGEHHAVLHLPLDRARKRLDVVADPFEMHRHEDLLAAGRHAIVWINRSPLVARH